MPINYAALATEINTDPLTLGYATPKAAGNDQAIAILLNAVGAGASYQVNREAIPVALLFVNIDATEFLALSDIKLQQLQAVLAAVSIDLNDASTRAILIGIFGNPSVTRTNLTAILKRQGSRAEVLFGRGTTITSNDVARALGRV